ncbi:MAG: hypothetical protein ACP5JG_01215, partial [Anaerolineae bacterium]
MKHKAYVWAALALLVIALPVAALAAGPGNIARIRRATARYHRLEVAEEDGFAPLTFEEPPTACISHPTEGAMGVHYMLESRFDDQLILEEPEVLIYDFEPNGEAKLVAAEYIVPAAAWTEADPPKFLGQTLQYKTTVGPHGSEDG